MQNQSEVVSGQGQHFTIKTLPFGITKKELVISAEEISYGGKVIRAEDLTFLSVRVVRSYVNGIRTGTQHVLTFGAGGERHVVKMSDMFYGSAKGKCFEQICGAVMSGVAITLLSAMVTKLKTGGEVAIGDAVFRADGVQLTPRKMLLIKGEPVLVPYARLACSEVDGDVCLMDRENKKAAISFASGRTENGCMVGRLCDFLLAGEGWRELQGQ